VATLLGGYVAKKLVFGGENLTYGSESDIKKATHLVCDLLKNCGMGCRIL
jgi:ATP-dependent Zn protease